MGFIGNLTENHCKMGQILGIFGVFMGFMGSYVG